MSSMNERRSRYITEEQKGHLSFCSRIVDPALHFKFDHVDGSTIGVMCDGLNI